MHGTGWNKELALPAPPRCGRVLRARAPARRRAVRLRARAQAVRSRWARHERGNDLPAAHPAPSRPARDDVLARVRNRGRRAATTSSPTRAARRSPASPRSGPDSATESTGCSHRREHDDHRHTNRLVQDYLRRLEQAAAPLPRSRRAELVAEIREHIDDALLEAGAADEVAVRNVLERLGPPEEIVAAAATPTGPTGRAGRLEIGALIALAVPFARLACRHPADVVVARVGGS